jgi:hypothetical protein
LLAAVFVHTSREVLTSVKDTILDRLGPAVSTVFK